MQHRVQYLHELIERLKPDAEPNAAVPGNMIGANKMILEILDPACELAVALETKSLSILVDRGRLPRFNRRFHRKYECGLVKGRTALSPKQIAFLRRHGEICEAWQMDARARRGLWYEGYPYVLASGVDELIKRVNKWLDGLPASGERRNYGYLYEWEIDDQVRAWSEAENEETIKNLREVQVGEQR